MSSDHRRQSGGLGHEVPEVENHCSHESRDDLQGLTHDLSATPPYPSSIVVQGERHIPSNDGPSLDTTRATWWKPFFARSGIIPLQITLNVILIVGSACFLIFSKLNNGFRVDHEYQLYFWHFVPTNIAVIDALYTKAIVSSVLLYQPYAVLQDAQGVNAALGLMLDYTGFLPAIAIRALRRGHWVALLASLLGMLAITYTSLTSAVFSPRSVPVKGSLQIENTRTLGFNGNINAATAFIRALTLASARILYSDTISFPPFTNHNWTVAPVDAITSGHVASIIPQNHEANMTISGWYGLYSDAGCVRGQLLNASFNELGVTVLFADQGGNCPLQSNRFPIEDVFAYQNAATNCGEADQHLATNGTLVFARLTPPQLLLGNTAAAEVIYCRPQVTVMSVDVTLDAITGALLQVDNVRPLSADQERRFNVTTGVLAGTWNGFIIDPSVDENIPPAYFDSFNQWVNETISVQVGTSWINSTINSTGIITDNPNAYNDDERAFYLGSLTDFYQGYLTLLAGASYFQDTAPTETTASLYMYQTRVFATPFFYGLIAVLSLSTLLLSVMYYLQPHTELQIVTPGTMLATVINIGKNSPDFLKKLPDARTMTKDQLEEALGKIGDVRLDPDNAELKEVVNGK